MKKGVKHPKNSKQQQQVAVFSDLYIFNIYINKFLLWYHTVFVIVQNKNVLGGHCFLTLKIPMEVTD